LLALTGVKATESTRFSGVMSRLNCGGCSESLMTTRAFARSSAGSIDGERSTIVMANR
jgi:hypothetical protein